MRPFWVALAALTRLPLPAVRAAAAAEQARAVPWYPAAGLVVGLLLALGAALVQGLPPFLAGTLITALWIGLTGTRTLRDLAAAVDGFLTGGGNPRRMAAAMAREERGRAARAAVVGVVLAKAIALGCLLGLEAWPAVVAVPLAGRLLLAGILATTPSSREVPGAGDLLPFLDRAAVLVGVLAGLALLTALLGTVGLGVGAALLGLGGLLRWGYKRTLGGFSGPLLGTAGELGDLLALGVVVWGLGAC